MDAKERQVLARSIRRWTTPNPLAARSARAMAAQRASGDWDEQREEIYQRAKRGQAELRRSALDDAAAGRWPAFLVKLTRAYRVEALLDVAPMMSDRDYWHAVGYVWSDAECLWQLEDEMRTLLGAPRAGREALMRLAEAEALAAMPEEFAVFRGAQRSLNERGWSWTLSRDRAVWFARRGAARPWEGRRRSNAATEPVLLAGSARRRDVVAYFDGRNEQEIVIAPESVRDVVATPVVAAAEEAAGA